MMIVSLDQDKLSWVVAPASGNLALWSVKEWRVCVFVCVRVCQGLFCVFLCLCELMQGSQVLKTGKSDIPPVRGSKLIN